MKETIKINLIEYYDGNERRERKSIEIQDTEIDSICNQIINHILPKNAEIELDEEEINEWITKNRKENQPLWDTITVARTNTFDIVEDPTEWITMEFSGTEYNLEHIIQQKKT